MTAPTPAPTNRLAGVNAAIHRNIYLLAMVMPVLSWGAAVLGVQWVGSPKALGARIDAVSMRATAGLDSLHHELKMIADSQSATSRKIDVVVILVCTKLTLDQKRLVSAAFTCAP